MLHQRGLLPILLARLEHWSIVVLTGARQTGKTTLVRELLPQAGGPETLYLSLDDPDERLRLAADPVRRLDQRESVVVLDEIQKLPALLDSVKLLADRKEGHRFLLLGSSQILLLKRVRETLAGRATLLELWPLALVERTQKSPIPSSGLDLIWREGERGIEQLRATQISAEDMRRRREEAEDHILWGGYPALERFSAEDRSIWLRDFRRTYLERDLADLGRVADLDQFVLAQNFLVARTGQLLSYSEVARELGVAVNTVRRYLRFLEISYQAFLLRPLLSTTTARLVKSPKLYWTDPGLARVLGEASLTDGALFETAVLCELLRWRSWQKEPPFIHFYRTRAGREVDFIVTDSARSRFVAMEVKTSQRAHRTDARAVEDVLHGRHTKAPAAAQRIGLVVTKGREIEPLSSSVWAIPFWRLFGPAD